jgi:hypothetical protein
VTVHCHRNPDTAPAPLRSAVRGGGPLVIFVVLAAATCALGRRPSPGGADHWTAADLLAHLRQAGPPLHVVPVQQENGPVSGIYLCTRPRRREELQCLLRVRKYADRWQGVVFADRLGAAGPPVNADDWGEHGMLVGQTLLFGDPELLSSLRATLPGG